MMDWSEQTREEARLYAEGKMQEDWDRKDGILIAVFYGHFIDYIMEELRKTRAWGKYEDWIKWNYTYDDYAEKYYRKDKNGYVIPFGGEYKEMDLRREYIKTNNL